MTWYELSQINMGLILKEIKVPQAYSPNDFAPPFDEILSFMKEKDTWCKEDLYTQFAPSELDSSLHAVMSLNGSSKEVDWAESLRKSREIYEISDELEKVGRAGKRGSLPDVMQISSKLRRFSNGEGKGLRLSKDINWQDVKGLQPSGWDAIDKTLGGIAESGPIVVFAATKTGKSFWTMKLLNEFLHYHTEKKAGVFTLELTDKRYLKRAFEMYPSFLEIHEQERIYVTHTLRTIDAIINDVGNREIDIAVIDGIDGLVRGEFSTSKFAEAWAGIIELGVIYDIPVVVTAQPNRENKWRAKLGEFLDIYAIEWSGAAENGAEQLIALQYVAYADDFTDERFPAYDDTYYMISWLQREGWKLQKGPGAIIFKDHKYDKDGNIRLWDGPAFGYKIPGSDKMSPQLFKEGARLGKKKSSRRKKEDD